MEDMRYVRWAEQEFSRADLGDKRRRQRLIQIGARMGAAPGGRITEVFATSAEREGAYRFVENEQIEAREIARSAHRATAGRCYTQEFVFVPVDASSLNLRDPDRRRGMGSIGTHGMGAQGMYVMSAIAVRRDGTPLGICSQHFWTRKVPVGLTGNDYDPRSIDEKESRYWIDAIAHVRAIFREEAARTRPWFQLDRGGDAGAVMAAATDRRELFTVRAAHNRRLATTIGNRRQYLWDFLRRQQPQASYVLPIPGGEKRSARAAHLHVRYCAITLDLRDRRSKRHRPLNLWAVLVGEIDTTPRGEDAIEWLLLTSHPVNSIDDAILVVDGYASRWRIEQFHKTWKTGACCVEDTQLQKRDHIERFAVISASAAMRIQRLTHLARTTPDVPATVELSRAEIEATILLRKPKGVNRRDIPTVEQVVHWLAELGGFMGPPLQKIRNAPDPTKCRRPGAIVVGRGLQKIETVATLLAEGVEL